MKRISVLNLSGELLALVIWGTAGLSVAIAALPDGGEFWRLLAVLASVALVSVGFIMRAEWRVRASTRWEGAVWIGTFVIVAFFLTRAIWHLSA